MYKRHVVSFLTLFLNAESTVKLMLFHVIAHISNFLRCSNCSVWENLLSMVILDDVAFRLCTISNANWISVCWEYVIYIKGRQKSKMWMCKDAKKQNVERKWETEEEREGKREEEKKHTYQRRNNAYSTSKALNCYGYLLWTRAKVNYNSYRKTHSAFATPKQKEEEARNKK